MKAFSEHLFAGSHEAAARLVLDGKADVGANFAHFVPGDMRTLVSSGWIEAGMEAEFRVLAVAGPIPTDVIVMHRTMAHEHQEDLIAAFQWVRERPEAESAHAIFRCDGLAAMRRTVTWVVCASSSGFWIDARHPEQEVSRGGRMSETDREPIIRFQNVHKAFGHKVIYAGLDLEVYSGETLTIIGGSGVGKSVMLRMLIGGC